MSFPSEAPSPAARRDRSIKARRDARHARAERERRILNRLNAGVSIDEIAAQERLSLKRMRNLVREILARRMPQPPAEFAALQISRLNEALMVSYSAMAGANLEAVDRVIRIVRELDRYHGFVAREAPTQPRELRFAPPPRSPLALEAPPADQLGNGAAND